MKHLLANGASIESLGENLGLDAACLLGHWRLWQFPIERGADVNRTQQDTGESPLHATLRTTDRLRRNVVLKVLLARGANPNCATKPNQPTGGFMRDCRSKGETALHRAAAFGDEEAIQLLFHAGAKMDAQNMHGDTPLSWASWYTRPIPILRQLVHGNLRIHPDYGGGMQAHLVGQPISPKLS
jgi:ankyrin repeat protein